MSGSHLSKRLRGMAITLQVRSVDIFFIDLVERATLQTMSVVKYWKMNMLESVLKNCRLP